METTASFISFIVYISSLLFLGRLLLNILPVRASHEGFGLPMYTIFLFAAILFMSSILSGLANYILGYPVVLFPGGNVYTTDIFIYDHDEIIAHLKQMIIITSSFFTAFMYLLEDSEITNFI